MKTGEIVIFRKRKEPSCGVFVSLNGEKLTIFSEEGATVSIAREKAVLFTGITVPDNLSKRELTMRMRNLRKSLEAGKKNFDLKTLWEKFGGSGEVVSFSDILSAYGAGGKTPPQEALALFWAVDKDTVYFKREKGGYLPLSGRCVEKKLLREQQTLEKQKQRQLSISWIKSVTGGSPLLPEGLDRELCVKTVLSYVKNSVDSPAFGDACVILSKAGIKDPETAVDFLIKTGALPQGTDPAMLRAGIAEGFSPEALEESAQLLALDSLPDFLEDLTALETFSIDNEDTEDIDDAISVEFSRGKARVGIHIANVAVCVPPDGFLDRFALEAAETMYLPERRVDIFPPDLVKGRLSLIEGATRAALSLFATFDGKTYEMLDFSFSASKISVNRNMSYETADDLFKLPGWNKLSDICARLKQKRIQNGAFTVQIPELEIKADSGGLLKVALAETGGVSHQVVSELMITANTLSAVFLRERGAPAIFRSQPHPVSEEAKALDPEDPLFYARVMKLLKPSKATVFPSAHRSLGVECYAQVTSPIRRYRDLVVQRQIMSEICGEAGLDESAVSAAISGTDSGINARRMAQRSRRRFWLCEHFRSLGKKAEMKAVVSRIADGRVFVYLPDYVLEFPLSGVEAGDWKEGSRLRVCVTKSDPVRRRLKLRPV